MVRYCELCAIKEVSNDLKKVRDLGLLLPEGSNDACDSCGLDYLKQPLGPPPEPPKGRKKSGPVKAVPVKVAPDPLRALYERIKYGYDPKCSCHDCRRIKDMIDKAGVYP